MNVLISNDDGINSPGIIKLAEAMKKIGAEVTVVAPASDRSTVGHSLTLHKPLRLNEIQPGFFAVSGSPADCVYMATRFLMKTKPDVVISGINRGANLGNDIFYSGTVAAAREGALFGIRSIAISLVIPHGPQPTTHYDSAARFAQKIVPKILESSHFSPTNNVINVNVPNLPFQNIKGVRIGRQGRRFYSDQISENEDPRGRKYYWLGGTYRGFEEIPQSDCLDVNQGYISVVPLKIDTTNYDLKTEFRDWEKSLWTGEDPSP